MLWSSSSINHHPAHQEPTTNRLAGEASRLLAAPWKWVNCPTPLPHVNFPKKSLQIQYFKSKFVTFPFQTLPLPASQKPDLGVILDFFSLSPFLSVHSPSSVNPKSIFLHQSCPVPPSPTPSPAVVQTDSPSHLQ